MSNLMITGVVDGPLTGGTPKAIEFYALNDIADLSVYGVGSANNGTGSDGIEFTFPAVSVARGTHLYLASEAPRFTEFFGFAPDFVSARAAAINGDDAIELFLNGTLADKFGQATHSGAIAWNYMDGWAARHPGSQPSPVFDINEWSFSGINALDNTTSNATAPVPFPLAAHTAPQALLINKVLGSTVGPDSEFIELIGQPGQSLDGFSIIITESRSGANNGRIDGRVDLSADHIIGDNGFFLIANALAETTYGVIANASIPGDFIKNSSYTVALVETASLTGNRVTGAEVVTDAIGIRGGDSGPVFQFGAPVVGPDGTFLPAGAIRVQDGVSTGQASDFIIADFNNNAEINNPRAGTYAVDVDAYRAVFIHDVQGETNLADGELVGVPGAADESPLLNELVRVQAVVTQLMPGLNGFYIQEEDADADDNPYTSEGVFIASTADVQVGDLVTVKGRVAEVGGETRINADAVTVDAVDQDLPSATVIEFPTATVLLDSKGDYVANLEMYEGMRVTIPQDMTVSELFQLDRFGTIRLTSDGRIPTFTQTNDPSVEGWDQFRKDVAARSLVLDDGSNVQNPAELQVPFLGNSGVLAAGKQFRMGDVYRELTGVMSFSHDSAASSERPEYRIHQPTDGQLIQMNPRPETAPEVGGTVKVAAFNVLNYFTTLTGTTGPANNLSPRGANNLAEFERQETKLVAAINAMGVDVVGLLEIENDPSGSASLIALTSALNAAGGNWGYVDAGPMLNVQNGPIAGDAIKNAFIYNLDTIELKGNVAYLDESVDERFLTTGIQRPAMAQTFTEKASGESFTAVVNHLKSKGSIALGDRDMGDGQGNNANIRANATAALVDWIGTDPTGTGEDKVVVLGDLNSYYKEDAIQNLIAGPDGIIGTADDMTDLGTAFEPGGHSYVFDGMTGTLDYAIANAALMPFVTGAAHFAINADEPDAFDYNLDFGRDGSLMTGDIYRASDHDPIIFGLDFGVAPVTYTLEILHMSDQEGNGSSIRYAPNASAVMNALEMQAVADWTIRLSSGDAFIPGVFYDASAAVFGYGGIADVQIQNELGWTAITLGNHEFDKGTAVLANLISGNAPANFNALVGSTLEGRDFTGTDMPYLAANLDVTTDANLAPLAVAGGQAPMARSITSSIVVENDGEMLGIVGATTPTLARISSAGGVTISPVWEGTRPTDAELDALADIIQAEVNSLLDANPGLNKIIVQTHMQVLSIELELASRLSDVDVIIAGGSNTRLMDENDRLIDGDVAQGTYPIFVSDKDGHTTAVVNTDGNYKYVGRLVLDFDENGRIIADSYDATVSGAYATDDQGVLDLNAGDMIDPEVQAIVNAIEAQIIATESNVFGISNVYLNGNRAGVAADGNPDGVRTQETNLGNLTADANLAYAQGFDETVTVSIKNGGGIRASIGEIVVPAGGTDYERRPNGEIRDSAGNIVKPEGGISQTDIQTALAFNNALSLLTLTRAELVAVLEHAVAAAPAAAGQFAQVLGVQFSFDPMRAAGDRIVSAAITDADGTDLDVLVVNGSLVGDAAGTVRVVTLGFMADGGDGYPFPQGAGVNRVDLADAMAGERDGAATFADNGTEQDAFAEYLAAFFATPETAYDQADGAYGSDDRIQNLLYRDDTVIDALPEPDLNLIIGTAGRDNLIGTDGDDLIVGAGGNFDMLTGGAGADTFYFGDEALNGIRERSTIMDYEVGVDSIALGHGVQVASIQQAGAQVVVYLNDPLGAHDAIYVRGAGVTVDNLTILTDYDNPFAFA
ncbi:ExeM/NucH family extracellular endonuclease [Paracoccus sp. (in: a-proteobacteria)]|uniref:ExeM/NucH family extracellular endonuclease n=1 Tax=Paracoccus sp. TaxID=267 RepID=UPI0026E042DD|nr:ExeM/NucH family extracellular endonuclease [Paracoccus sp. (in: a-proteobacteria)]MDO5647476.1 ExeM/NucH family extracellular endonuclease [Paracoccus sp. (in: a-proteobacteria)]